MKPQNQVRVCAIAKSLGVVSLVALSIAAICGLIIAIIAGLEAVTTRETIDALGFGFIALFGIACSIGIMASLFEGMRPSCEEAVDRGDKWYTWMKFKKTAPVVLVALAMSGCMPETQVDRTELDEKIEKTCTDEYQVQAEPILFNTSTESVDASSPSAPVITREVWATITEPAKRTAIADWIQFCYAEDGAKIVFEDGQPAGAVNHQQFIETTPPAIEHLMTVLLMWMVGMHALGIVILAGILVSK